MRRNRPFADSGGTMAAGGRMHERASGVPAAQRDGNDDDDDGSYVEITIEVRDDSLVLHERPRAASRPHGVPVPGGGSDGEGDVTLPAQTPEKRPYSLGRNALHNASARIKQVSEELRQIGPSRIGRSNFAAPAYPLTFVSPADASAGWAAVERRFDEEATDGLLHRSKFAKCIGMKELAFAGELFDALARRRGISGDRIDKPEMLELWDQISDPSFDSRLHTFIDMIDKDADGRISEQEVKEMIELSANANNLTIIAQHSEEHARFMMEELDTYNRGYIQWKLLRETASHLSPVGTSTNNSNPSQRLWPGALLQWYRGARCSLNQKLRMAPYACERMARPLRSSARRPVDVLGVTVYPDPASAVSLRFSKPQGFRYRSGQYVFLNCPAVSRSEWRPFYITSAPQDDHVSVHIRTLGEWTQELNNVFSKVCPGPTKEKSEILRAEYEQNDTISNPSFPKVLMDGPYGAPTQDYKQYDAVLLVGVDIGAAPMISIIKDIINNMKQLDGDDQCSNRWTQRAYFYWVNQEQGSIEWFHGAMEEVVEANNVGVINLHTYCTSLYEEGDARSTLISLLQFLNHAKHGVDVVSGTHVKTHFGPPNWKRVYQRITLSHIERVGVFYCGTPMLTKELSKLADNFSRETRTKFEFHNANF